MPGALGICSKSGAPWQVVLGCWDAKTGAERERARGATRVSIRRFREEVRLAILACRGRAAWERLEWELEEALLRVRAVLSRDRSVRSAIVIDRERRKPARTRTALPAAPRRDRGQVGEAADSSRGLR